MSFNLDDPLAGILSDGSDDSFFDDDILGKKKPSKKSATPVAEKKNALFNLEDTDVNKSVLASDNKKAIIQNESKTHFYKAQSSAPLKRAASKEKVQITDPLRKSDTVPDNNDFSKSRASVKPAVTPEKLDILGDLFSEPKKEIQKPLQRGKSSQSLFDDILGTSSTKPVSRPTTAAVSQELDLDKFLEKSDSKLSISSKNIVPSKADKPKLTPTVNPTKTKSSDDWLGIFHEKDNNPNDDDGMPAWLSGSDTKTKIEGDKKAHKPEPAKHYQDAEDLKESIKSKEDEPNRDISIKPLQSEVISLQTTNDDVAAEGAALYLQQQESQLMVALQLKAQEEKLAAMQMRQKESQRVQREAALAQHSQLDSMIQRQIEQRRQMQAVISAHQDRITQRIKTLLSSSNIEDPIDTNDDGKGADVIVDENREHLHSRERKQLLQLVQSLQENHDKEIDLMETSYRRQLAFQEVSLNQAEERMKEESNKLVKFYSEKTVWLEEHHQLFKQRMEDNMTSLIEHHKTEKDTMRQQHLENIRILQEHHSSLMENVKNAIKAEQNLIKDSVSFSSELTELVTDVKESRSECKTLLEQVKALTESAQQSNNKSLDARETQITDMIIQLRRDREAFEAEKTENREVIKLLETRLKQMTVMIEEETSSMKQKKMEMEFEKATFNKQTEFAKDVLKRQEDEIKMVRAEIEREYQERKTKMEEEKSKIIKDSAVIAKEKSSIQNIKQELNKMKAELQAQLEEVTDERSKLSIERQQMHLEEQRILAKSRDLDLLAKTAIDKQSQADKKYSEAEFLQRKYEERIRRIQEHVVSLNSREKQIAKEKVALSRERLSIHNERKEMERNFQCSICKSQNISHLYEGGYSAPELYRNISKDYANLNVSSTVNAIEQEMATLMRKHLTRKPGEAVYSSHFVNKDTPHEFKTINEDEFDDIPVTQVDAETYKEYMDPKFMMLRLDVQRVLNNVDTAKDEGNINHQLNEEKDDLDPNNE